MAALVKEELDLDTALEPGDRGEFTVWVNGRKVAEKTRSGFPTETAIVNLIRQALE